MLFIYIIVLMMHICGQGFQGCGLSILRIRYLVPRMVCLLCCYVIVDVYQTNVVLSQAILRIGGCLNSTPLLLLDPLGGEDYYYWIPSGDV